MPVEFDAVIFDLDGTLTVPQHDFEAIRRHLGIPPGAYILEHLEALPEDKSIAKHRELHRIEAELAGTSAPALGLVDLLERLRTSATPMAILTRNSRSNALISLAAIGAREYFPDHLIAGRDEAAPKPAPDGIVLLADRMRIPPGRCLMVGDSHHDLRAGRAAGCGDCASAARRQRRLAGSG